MSTEHATPRGRIRAPFDGRRLARLARRAGAIALEEATGARREPAGRSARTVAHAIESWLASEAHQATPRVHVTLAHETGPLPAGEWILSVDALDGVDAYLAGLPTWTVALGLLHRGEPWSAAVFAPALNDLYVASSGTLRWQGREVSPDEARSGPSGFVLGTGLEKRSILRLRRRREAEGPVSYHACLVARGAAEGAILGRLTLREAAPLLSLLEPVGGELVSLRSARPLDLRSLRDGQAAREPVLAAAAGRAADLVTWLKR